VLHAAQALTSHGFDLSVVAPDSDGIVQPAAIEAALRSDTCLISLMTANNEVGTLQPINEVAALARRSGVICHTDATQAAGALRLDVEELGVDLLSLSAHKFYGPKGVGLLYLRRGTPFQPQQQGGGQENTRRGGTENLPGIVGMATALSLALDELEPRAAHCRRLRDRLIDGILERLPDARLNGHTKLRLPNNANFSFAGIDGETLLLSLDLLGIAASSGSACTTGSTEPSHVLTALGLDAETARGSLRLTVGKDNTPVQIERAIDDGVGRVSVTQRWQLSQRGEAEKLQEGSGRGVLDRGSGGWATAERFDQLTRYQRSQHAAGVDAAHCFDLGPGDRLAVGYQRECLQRRPGELRRAFQPEQPGDGGAKTGRGDQLDARPQPLQDQPPLSRL
jgi:cysteine sulfinate desulfinase/cysteine desulfurase-like protein